MTEATMVAELRAVLGDAKVLDGEGARRVYDCDAYTVDRYKPTCIVLPETTEEVAEVVRWCNRHQIPFTARGAGTGLSGGVLPALGGVVISTKKLTRILEIDVPNRCLLAQSGIANKRISDAVKAHGLHFAPDPSSQTVSTLGGNIAENAGGPHTLKYGVTVQHVLGVTMVDPEGEILHIGGKVPGGPGFDLLSLVVGGEGTVGIVTEAWVKLTPLPDAVMTALISFPTVRDATQTVADIIAEGTIPAALEFMDRNILVAVKAAFGLTYPEGTEALLLVECDACAPNEHDLLPVPIADTDAPKPASPLSLRGAKPVLPTAFGQGIQPGAGTPDPTELEEDAPRAPSSRALETVEAEMAVVRSVAERNGALEVRIAADEVERALLWKARKKAVGAMGRLAPSIVTHDGVIPRSKLPEMLDYVYEVAAKHGLGIANMFHAGDGNLHPCFYFDDREPGKVDAVVEAGEDIIRKCIELGGSVTGEHGVGVEKIDLMPLMFAPEDLALQALAKRIFNEGDLCNPCKVLPNQKACVEHKMRWRGVAW